MRRLPAIHPRAVRLLAALLVIGVAASTLAGCGRAGNEPQAPTPTAPTQTESPRASATPKTTSKATSTASPTRTATLYFADADAQELVEESRPTTATGSDLRAALVELAKGPPSGSGRQPALPQGTAIVGTDVQDGQALVNLSGEFGTGYPSGGAAAEFAVLAPLVYTATAVDGVERVRITVDGQTPAPVGSQYDWTSTFSRADFPDAVAAP